ncbi:MAG: hypothetical protein ACT4QA_01140 [Panacagrimonas sp.]
MLTEAVGWSAAIVLLITMARQVWSQWNSGAVGGISQWLFVGQVAASGGFTVYSVLLGSTVFIVTNALMLLNALAGLWIDRRNRRRKAAQQT